MTALNATGKRGHILKLANIFRSHRSTRRLRLVETLPLGERRLAAILSVDGREFLVAATPQSVSLLGELAIEGDEHASAALSFATATGLPPGIQ